MDRRWDKSKPPQGPFALNEDCIQAQGLILWYPVGAHGSKAVYDLVGTNHATTLTALTPTLGTTGEPALSFENGSSSVIQSSVPPIYAAPLSFGIWLAKTTAGDTVGYGIGSIGETGANSSRFQFDTYAGDVRWIPVNASGTAAPATKSGIVSGRWHHALGIEISSTSRYAALDGVVGAQNTDPVTPTNTPARFCVGAVGLGASVVGHFTGQIGEACIWNRSVLDDRALLADPGRRFELWYPLRSRKWFTQGVATPSIAALRAFPRPILNF